MRHEAPHALQQPERLPRHGVALGPQHHQRQAACTNGQCRQVPAVCVRRQHADLAEEVRRQFGCGQAQKVLHLRKPDEHRNAVGEADDDGQRHVAHQRAQFEEAHGEQQHASQRSADEQVGQAVALDDAVDDDDESTCWPADLHVGTTQGADQEAGNDGRENALLGLHSAGNGKGHGQRQGDDTHGEAGAHVGNEPARVVAPQGVNQPWAKGVKWNSGHGVSGSGFWGRAEPAAGGPQW